MEQHSSQYHSNFSQEQLDTNSGVSKLSANKKRENSSSGSMYKTNQSDFVTTVGLGIKKNLKGCFWMDLGDNYSNNEWLKLL